jgi:hypothetical protein
MLGMEINTGWGVNNIRLDLFEKRGKQSYQLFHMPFVFGKVKPNGVINP